MLYTLNILVIDKSTVVTSVAYIVDIGCTPKVNGRTVFDACAPWTHSIVGDYTLPSDYNPIPKEIWPVVASSLRQREINVNRHVNWFSLVHLRGKRFQVNICLRGVVPQRLPSINRERA